LTAFGVINELASQGIRVPDDISVMGFDNIEFSRMVTPALTTIW
jgi:LacI family transcriptional regulator